MLSLLKKFDSAKRLCPTSDSSSFSKWMGLFQDPLISTWWVIGFFYFHYHIDQISLVKSLLSHVVTACRTSHKQCFDFDELAAHLSPALTKIKMKYKCKCKTRLVSIMVDGYCKMKMRGNERRRLLCLSPGFCSPSIHHNLPELDFPPPVIITTATRGHPTSQCIYGHDLSSLFSDVWC